MDKKQFDKLRTNVSSFCKINFFQYSDINGNKPTGLFCSTVSNSSKDYVMQQVRDAITFLKFDYTVSDEGLFNTHHFVIHF